MADGSDDDQQVRYLRGSSESNGLNVALSNPPAQGSDFAQSTSFAQGNLEAQGSSVAQGPLDVNPNVDDALAALLESEESDDPVFTAGDDLLIAITNELQETQGERVPDKVAALLNAVCLKDFKKPGTAASEVMEKLRLVSTPENLSFLQPTRVNDSVFRALTASTAKRVNQEGHTVELALTRAICLQTKILQQLTTNTMSDSAKQDSIRKLAQSTEFLAFSRHKVNELRREVIVSNLNANYKSLGNSTKVENGLLFGSQLETSMREVESASKLTRRLSRASGSGSPFLGPRPPREGHFYQRNSRQRGRGWRRGYPPHRQYKRGSGQQMLHQ